MGDMSPLNLALLGLTAIVCSLLWRAEARFWADFFDDLES